MDLGCVVNRFRVFLIGGFAVLSTAAELPVKEVVLYKNGVGYFERSGPLRPGESARLDFKAEEMNDVLKSLTVRDLSGGNVSGVRYDSADPLEKKLSEFPFRLGTTTPVSAFLDQMKGARIETSAGSGAIVGSRIVKGPEGSEKEQVSLLADDGTLRSFDLSGITSLKFSDPLLQQQLKDYLGTLTASRSKDKKSVYIDSPNDKARNLAVSYLAPTPIWKSSYRLILPATGEPTLEGWAIVDNTSGEDWAGVKIALISGRPVSFLSRLYEPRYVARQFAELPEDAAARPQVYQGGIIGGVAGGAPAAAYAAPPPPAPRQMAKRLDQNCNPAMAGRPGFDRNGCLGSVTESVQISSASVDTESHEVGELFEYRFSTPITVKRNESAMLPFLQQKVSARKLLIWTEGLNPRNAAEITNNTGKTLDGGPITVFDGGAYGGEALVETVKQGDKRLISYAVDLGTRVANEEETGDEVIQEVRANRGTLTVKSTHRSTTTYSVKNVDAKAKTLVIEHPLQPDSKVIGTQPTETTAKHRRFEVALKPNSDQKFPVLEEQVLSETVMVTNLTPDVIASYVRAKSISDAGRRALQQVGEAKAAIAQANREFGAASRQIADLEKDQDRLRKNLQSLGAIAGQQDVVQRYAKQLSDQETQIAALRDTQAKLRVTLDQREAELSQMVEKLTF